jgi:sulfide:quinone oxidoreductase
MATHRVIIAGGGVGGLEAALALHALATDAVGITVLEPAHELVDTPMLVARAFGGDEVPRVAISDILAGTGVRHLSDRIESVAPAAQSLRTSGGDDLEYDSLIVATGARAVPAFHSIATFRPDALEPIRSLLDDLAEGRVRSVAYVIPPGPAWPLPAYELALMTAAHTADAGQHATITVVTPEPQPLAAFGPAASAAVGKLLADSGVAVMTDAFVEAGPAGGLLVIHPGRRHLDTERVVALPRLEARRVAGLPAGRDGFLPIDRHCRVREVEHVYAIGDVAGFPVKHGVLAAQMAGVAAQDISAVAGVALDPTPFAPILRGTLLTGGARHYLRGAPHHSIAAEHLLWWPPAKVAAPYLAPVLAEESGDVLLDLDHGPQGLAIRHELDPDLASLA